MKSSVAGVGHFVPVHSKDSLFGPGPRHGEPGSGIFRASASRRVIGMDDFYDRMAPLYDLIFPDWDASIERQADGIAGIIHERWRSGGRSVLDVACGIGTQSIGLARRGFAV